MALLQNWDSRTIFIHDSIYLNNSVMEHFWENIIFVIIDQQKILYKKVYSVFFFLCYDWQILLKGYFYEK